MEQIETKCVLRQMGCIDSLLSKKLRLEESNEYTFSNWKKKFNDLVRNPMELSNLRIRSKGRL